MVQCLLLLRRFLVLGLRVEWLFLHNPLMLLHLLSFDKGITLRFFIYIINTRKLPLLLIGTYLLTYLLIYPFTRRLTYIVMSVFTCRVEIYFSFVS